MVPQFVYFVKERCTLTFVSSQCVLSPNNREHNLLETTEICQNTLNAKRPQQTGDYGQAGTFCILL